VASKKIIDIITNRKQKQNSIFEYNYLNMKEYLPYIQIIISVLIIIFVLLQQGGNSLGSSFGQEGGYYTTRRGIQKKIFWATIVLGVLFVATALLNLLS